MASSSPSLNPANPLGSPLSRPVSDKITHIGLARRLSQLLSSTHNSPNKNDLSDTEAEKLLLYQRDQSSRKTKITCTLGPSSTSVEQIMCLLDNGMNVARLNFSHGSHESHLAVVNNIREAMRRSGKVCAIMLDTKGPEIRTGLLPNGKPVTIKTGQELAIRCSVDFQSFIGCAEEICVDYANLVKVVKVGSIVKIDDGLLVAKVIEVNENGGVIKVICLNSAELGQRKGVNLPNAAVDLPAVTPRDKLDLLFAVEHGLDFIAASFTRDGAGVREIKQILGEKGKNIKIISKIENQQGLDNFDDILKESDGIMVARGDLGVEIPIQKVCIAQKMMIRKCNLAGKYVITATQMLESMITNPRPTRAEATDVANAVFDGTDCVMLSGETAKGDYPFEACACMAKICRSAEVAIDHYAAFNTMVYFTQKPMSRMEAICSSAVKTAMDLECVKCIVVLSESGASARLICKYRPSMPVLMISRSKQLCRQSKVIRGLWALEANTEDQDEESLCAMAIQFAHQQEWLKLGKGETGKCAQIVLVSGMIAGQSGTTNAMKVIDVPSI